MVHLAASLTIAMLTFTPVHRRPCGARCGHGCGGRGGDRGGGYSQPRRRAEAAKGALYLVDLLTIAVIGAHQDASPPATYLLWLYLLWQARTKTLLRAISAELAGSDSPPASAAAAATATATATATTAPPAATPPGTDPSPITATAPPSSRPTTAPIAPSAPTVPLPHEPSVAASPSRQVTISPRSPARHGGSAAVAVAEAVAEVEAVAEEEVEVKAVAVAEVEAEAEVEMEVETQAEVVAPGAGAVRSLKALRLRPGAAAVELSAQSLSDAHGEEVADYIR